MIARLLTVSTLKLWILSFQLQVKKAIECLVRIYYYKEIELYCFNQGDLYVFLVTASSSFPFKAPLRHTAFSGNYQCFIITR